MSRLKVEMEFLINVSPDLLLSFISVPENLERWFCDTVKDRGNGNFVFIWDKNEDLAKIVKNNNFDLVQFKFNNDDSENEFSFEFRIDEDELTGDISLIITDYMDEEDIDDLKLVWEKQVNKLKSILGSNA